MSAPGGGDELCCFAAAVCTGYKCAVDTVAHAHGHWVWCRVQSCLRTAVLVMVHHLVHRLVLPSPLLLFFFAVVFFALLPLLEPSVENCHCGALMC